LPRDEALQPDVLRAYRMTGRDPPLDPGYPVRALAPGHYGMASVKRLAQVRARTPQEPGRYTLLSRARGAGGSAQPARHDPSYGGYVITHPLPIEVFVDGPAGTSG
jgi:DMSO/TMAO reductase YedYZ molybdopterin-dependent catalytic subunit